MSPRPWDVNKEDQYELDDAWLHGQPLTMLLLRFIIREELYRLDLITQEQRDDLGKRIELPRPH